MTLSRYYNISHQSKSDAKVARQNFAFFVVIARTRDDPRGASTTVFDSDQWLFIFPPPKNIRIYSTFFLLSDSTDLEVDGGG